MREEGDERKRTRKEKKTEMRKRKRGVRSVGEALRRKQVEYRSFSAQCVREKEKERQKQKSGRKKERERNRGVEMAYLCE